MNVFIIFYEDDVPSEIVERAQGLFKDGILSLSSRVLLVRTYADDPGILSTAFDLSGTETPPKIGIIFKLNGSFAGNYYPNVWDWLKDAREQTVG